MTLRSAPRRFTLIELLVVVAIIAILASLLLPALASASEKGKRALCMNNVKQVGVALDMYADDMNEHYPIHGYAGQFLHHMTLKHYFRGDYLGNVPRIMYCPSATYFYGHANTRKPAGDADAYLGYAYWGGHGLDDRTAFAPHGWTAGASARTPTLSRLFAMQRNNAAERPLLMDAAGFGGTFNREAIASRPAFPANNHQAGEITVPVYENIVFTDGHAEGIGMPILNRPLRVAHGRASVGSYYF